MSTHALALTGIVFVTLLSTYISICILLNFFDWGKNQLLGVFASVISLVGSVSIFLFYPALGMPCLFFGIITTLTSTLRSNRLKRLKQNGELSHIYVYPENFFVREEKGAEGSEIFAPLEEEFIKDAWHSFVHVIREENHFLGTNQFTLFEKNAEYDFLCYCIGKDKEYTYWEILKPAEIKRKKSLQRTATRVLAFIAALCLCVGYSVLTIAGIMSGELNMDIYNYLYGVTVNLTGVAFLCAVWNLAKGNKNARLIATILLAVTTLSLIVSVVRF